MTNSELNEFLGGIDYQSELVEKLETLQQTLEQAMQPIVPKYKETHPWDKQTTDVSHIYKSDANLYQKAVLVYMHLNPGPQTSQQIANATGMSITSVKRVITHYMSCGEIMRAPYQRGYLLTQFA